MTETCPFCGALSIQHKTLKGRRSIQSNKCLRRQRDQLLTQVTELKAEVAKLKAIANPAVHGILSGG